MVLSSFVDIVCEFVCVFIESMILIASQKWKPTNNKKVNQYFRHEILYYRVNIAMM